MDRRAEAARLNLRDDIEQTLLRIASTGIVIKARKPAESLELLKRLGMPFRQPGAEQDQPRKQGQGE